MLLTLKNSWIRSSYTSIFSLWGLNSVKEPIVPVAIVILIVNVTFSGRIDQYKIDNESQYKSRNVHYRAW